jgi:hypothetical protein
MKAACFGRKPLPAGTLASNGDKMACVINKVVQFAAELEAPSTDAEERLVALKFLLHFVIARRSLQIRGLLRVIRVVLFACPCPVILQTRRKPDAANGALGRERFA